DYLLSNNYKFDLVSLDCTEGNRHISYHGHMCIERNIIVKDRMLRQGLANEKTIFVINHFSHNGRNVNYDEMSVIAKDNGFVNSYDGMEIKF
ncbi:MAG: PhnP protein, partial [Clostridia bacterium]|nr:PhnP protein [Clostridia bacterium]